jgi:dimethylamine monooxygenase subunit C
MTRTEFPPAIRSRPVYDVLKPRAGAFHLIVADGEGADAVVALAGAAPDLMGRAHVLYTTGPNGTDGWEKIAALGARQAQRAASIPTLLVRLQRVLQDMPMGAQIYLTGTEGLMGQAERDVMALGFPHVDIQKEHRGSTVRRVQCVHCKGITEDVRTDPFPCGHCGLHLFVRDHYSRRIAAFQGVNIDAEDKGQIPPAVERFR